MSDERQAFEQTYSIPTGAEWCEKRDIYIHKNYSGLVLHPINESWEAFCEGALWQASRQAVSVPEETLTAIHDTLRLVWSRELSADDGLDEIEILIPPASADVPEGWKIVPIYSTTEMDNAAREANYQMFIDRDHADAVWTAMIAASPCVSQSAESEPPKQEEDQ